MNIKELLINYINCNVKHVSVLFTSTKNHKKLSGDLKGVIFWLDSRKFEDFRNNRVIQFNNINGYLNIICEAIEN